MPVVEQGSARAGIGKKCRADDIHAAGFMVFSAALITPQL